MTTSQRCYSVTAVFSLGIPTFFPTMGQRSMTSWPMSLLTTRACQQRHCSRRTLWSKWAASGLRWPPENTR